MSAIAPTAAPPVTGHPRRGLILALMSSCTVLTIALVAAINVALPSLASDVLRPSSSQLLWIVDSYVIVFACLLIPAGAFGDRFGRKGALMGGLALFAAGCLVAALAESVPLLLAGRALSGAGAALIMPATLSITVHAFPPEKRAQAIGGWTAATGVAGVVGNIGGGALLEDASWRALFWSAGPLALALLLVVALAAPKTARHRASLDLPGSALLVVAFLGLLYGIIEGPELGWASAWVLGGFALAAAVFTVYTLYALRAANPVLDPRLFAGRALRAGAFGVTATFLGMFGLFFMNAQYLQFAKGYTPLVTGLAIGPLAVIMMVMTRRAAELAARLGRVPVVTGGLLLIAAGLGLMSTADAGTHYWVYAAEMSVVALGMGLSLPLLSTVIMTAVPHERAGLGSGLNSATREVGSALGVAVVGTVLTAGFSGALPEGVPSDSVAHALAVAGPARHDAVVDAFTGAMSAGFRVTAIVLAVSAVLVAMWLRPSRG
ncbi:MFS transporter [Actinorhabdospora filicis]|uniref:MFS transporter n=1 Tax=Actinorhabdospora filicis TaxID=1785913 RepID=A0A9W6W9V2_9ACTN|nr:MFS transporter [Actinorhabdospora filicis]GLZ79024.1 MFS transporter [Actinorhabdospora filicis]